MDSTPVIAAVDIYDGIMLAVLVGATVFGAWKGMAWQVTSLASIVVSGIVAIRFGGSLAPFISDQAPWNRFIAMLILYLATSFSIWVIFRLVAGVIDRVKLKEFDRQMGALFGIAKGILFCVVITFFAVTLSERLRQTVLASFSGRCIAKLIKNATPVMPVEVTEVVGKYLEELDRRLDPEEPPTEGLLDRATAKSDSTGGVYSGESINDLDPRNLIDGAADDVRNGVNSRTAAYGSAVDDKLDALEKQANDKLDEAQKNLGKKAAELRDTFKNNFDSGGK